MHYREMPSPLRGQNVGFLDDLFVHPDYRGKSVVDELFAALRQAAKMAFKFLLSKMAVVLCQFKRER